MWCHAMTQARLKVDEGSTALHVVADALSCTSVEAEEDISRLEAFTSFAGERKTALQLGLDDQVVPIIKVPRRAQPDAFSHTKMKTKNAQKPLTHQRNT